MRRLGALRLLAAPRRLACTPPSPSVLETYRSLVRGGALRPDASQARAVALLSAWDSPIADESTRRPAGVYLHGAVGSGKSMLMDLLCASAAREARRFHFHELMAAVHAGLHAAHAARPRRLALTKSGRPIWKFGDAAEEEGGRGGGERRGEAAEKHPVEAVADRLVPPQALLCLDEMQVTDVADAMLLSQLFNRFFARGVRVVFTSNRPPDKLYERGLNRKYFEPFVQLLYSRCHVVAVGEGGVDYRQLAPLPDLPAAASLRAAASVARRPRGAYFFGEGAAQALERAWRERVEGERARGGKLSGEEGGEEEGEGGGVVEVAFGRRLCVPRWSRRAAWFDFDGLCGQPLGGPDFLALASRYDSVWLAGVPTFTVRQRNEARRMVVLLDTLYEARVQLFISAEAAPSDVFEALLCASAGEESLSGAEIEVGTRGVEPTERVEPTFEEAPVGGRFRVDGELAPFFTAKDEGFMLRRTMSRLAEMCEQRPCTS
ncbi:hypothetical protein AB1Y20_002594 [Prymnesium parvum]|uniref:AFG1-like ATPase n=1 Tax=Prymnesium parvum TaxID=97485 RepID=A0AB34J9R9_PRYPA